MHRLLLLLLAGSFQVLASPPPLPSFVSDLLAETDAELTLPKGSYDPAIISLYSTSETNEPWSVTGDFNGDGKADWAGLLRNTSGQLLLIAVYSQDREYVPVTLARLGEDQRSLNMGIRLKVPGVINGISTDTRNRSPQLKLQHPGIHLFYFEKASVLYYWQTDEFKQLMTSD